MSDDLGDTGHGCSHVKDRLVTHRKASVYPLAWTSRKSCDGLFEMLAFSSLSLLGTLSYEEVSAVGTLLTVLSFVSSVVLTPTPQRRFRPCSPQSPLSADFPVVSLVYQRYSSPLWKKVKNGFSGFLG